MLSEMNLFRIALLRKMRKGSKVEEYELKRIDFRNALSIPLYNEQLADDELLKYVKSLHMELTYCYIWFNSNGDYLTRDLLDEL